MDFSFTIYFCEKTGYIGSSSTFTLYVFPEDYWGAEMLIELLCTKLFTGLNIFRGWEIVWQFDVSNWNFCYVLES